MNILQILKIIACLATAATGVLALVKPDLTYGFIGLTANGVRGVSEIHENAALAPICMPVEAADLLDSARAALDGAPCRARA